MKQYRQGDVFLEEVSEIPANAVVQSRDSARLVVELGQATGHAHAFYDASSALLHAPSGERFLRIVEPTALKHEEHAPIELPPGSYRVRRQREYHPEEIRTVVD